MLFYRSEIRNSPKEQTIKVFLKEIHHNDEVKDLVECIDGVQMVEIRQSVERNRVSEHLTIFKHEDSDINHLHDIVTHCLNQHFDNRA